MDKLFDLLQYLSLNSFFDLKFEKKTGVMEG